MESFTHYKEKMAGYPRHGYLDSNQIRNHIDKITPILIKFISEVDNNDFHKTESPEKINTEISKALPFSSKPFEELIQTLTDKFIPRFPSTGNKHFLAYIPGDPALEGILGAMMTPFFNQFVGSVQGSPGGTAVESLVITWIAELLSLPKSTFGSFTTGGSEANMICIYTGLVQQCQQYGFNIKEDGIPSKRMMIYISDEAHNSIEKAVLLLGLGRKSVRYVKSDDNFRMTASTVKQAIMEDKKKYGKDMIPIMIIGTAGTTNTGSIDDLDGLSDLAITEKMWFHIDGAYGAFASLCKPKLFKGLTRTNSIALDAHKWLYAPFESGIALVAEHEIMRNAFDLTADYLIDSELKTDIKLQRNFRSYGFHLTRELRGLKIWFLINSMGLTGIKNSIMRNLIQAEYLRHRIVKHPEFNLVHNGELAIVCFNWNNDEIKTGKIIDILQSRRNFYLSRTLIGEQIAIRVCFLNLRSDLELVDNLLAELQSCVNIIESEE